METIKNLEQKNIVYFDESGIDNNEHYPYAWGLRGPRIYAEKPGHSSQRTTILAGLSNTKLCAPFIFEGHCNRPILEFYFQNVLLPSIGSGKTIVLDNASFHKGGNIQSIVENAGCFLLYLPAYSPDLNPIEHHWFGLKNNIRRELQLTSDPSSAIITVFEKMGNS